MQVSDEGFNVNRQQIHIQDYDCIRHGGYNNCCIVQQHTPTFSERMLPWHDVIIWISVALIIATILHHLIYKAWRTYQYEAETERMEMEKEVEENTNEPRSEM